MAYSTADLDAIRDAMRQLAVGNRVGEFRHNGILMRYTEVTMTDLRRFEAEIMRELNPRPRRIIITSDKGL